MCVFLFAFEDMAFTNAHSDVKDEREKCSLNFLNFQVSD